MAKKKTTTRNTDFNYFYYTDNNGTKISKYFTAATATKANPNITLADANDYIEKTGQEIIEDANNNFNTQYAKKLSYNGSINTDYFNDKTSEVFRIYGAPHKMVLDDRQQYNNCGVECVLNILAMAGIKTITNQNKTETSFTKQLWSAGLIDDSGTIGKLDSDDGGSLPEDYRKILGYYGINSTSYACSELGSGTGDTETVSLDVVADTVKNGGAAILAVSSDLLWGRNNATVNNAVVDHAITVTGVVYDSNDNLIGFYIQDTGLWMSRYISKEDLAECTLSDVTNRDWKTTQGVFGTVVTDNIKSYTNNLHLYGSKYDNILTGNSGNNVIKGYNGNDTLYGMGGVDKLYGGNGNDYLDGGSGDDYLYGESGNDTIIGGDGNNYIRGGNGNDWIFGNEGINKDITMTDDNDILTWLDNNASELTGRNTIYGDSGNDHIFGGNYNDIIYGGNGNDGIYGRGGIDAIYGGNGNDTIYGGDGNDRISGDAGNDTLIGGAGDDVIICGSGKDTVRIGSSDGLDRVVSSSGSVTFEIDTSALLTDYDYDDSTNSVLVNYDTDNGFEYQGFFNSRRNKYQTAYLKDSDGESYRLSATKSRGRISVLNKKKGNNILYSFSESNNTVTTSKNNDIVFMSGGDNTITYTGGKDKYYSDDGDDTYVVSSFDDNTYLSINDCTSSSGEYLSTGDKLNIMTSDSSGIRLFFDVQNNGKTSLNNDNLYLIYSNTDFSADFAKDVLNETTTGVISVSDYFNYDKDISGNERNGNGCIESISLNGKNRSNDISSLINSISQNVTSWLSNTEHAYDSVISALNDNSANVTDLLACFNVVNPT